LFLSSNLLSFYLSRFYRIFLEYYPFTSFYLLHPIKRGVSHQFHNALLLFNSFGFAFAPLPNVNFLYLMVNPIFYGTFVRGA
jgi:hypothetical protein